MGVNTVEAAHHTMARYGTLNRKARLGHSACIFTPDNSSRALMVRKKKFHCQQLR